MRNKDKAYCKVCGKMYRPCVGCFAQNIAITPRKYTCSNECFVEFVLMQKGESNLIRITYMDGEKEKIGLIDKINKNTLRLKDVERLINFNEILAVTYCPKEKLQELAEFFKSNEGS